MSKAQPKYNVRHSQIEKVEPIKPVVEKVEMPVYDNEPLSIRKKKGHGFMKLTPQMPMYIRYKYSILLY